MKTPLAWRSALVFCFLSSVGQASLLDSFGLGGQATARVSGVTADTSSGFAAGYNPALLPLVDKTLFTGATVWSHSEFAEISQVRGSDTRFANRDTTAPLSEFAARQQTVASWSVGFQYPFRTGSWGNLRAGFGLVASGPYENLRTFQAATPYDFYSLRYGTSDGQFKTAIAAGLEVIPQTLSVGAGLALYLSAAGNADATLVGNNPNSRLSFDVGLNTAAFVGLSTSFAGINGSLVWRQAVDPSFEQKINGRVQWGANDIVAQPFTVRTTLYYEPQSIESDWQKRFHNTTLSIGASYQFWQSYRPPFLITETVRADGTAQKTEEPDLGFHNTFSPRLSIAHELHPRFQVAAGYQYRPTPTGDLSGPTNTMDNTAHVVGLGFRHNVAASAWVPIPFTWGISGQYHVLEPRQIVKEDPKTLGSPGYRLAGEAFSVGLCLTADL